MTTTSYTRLPEIKGFLTVDTAYGEGSGLTKWRVLNLIGNAACLAAVCWLRYLWNDSRIGTMTLFWWAWPCVVLWMTTIWVETHLRRRDEYYVPPRGFEVEPRDKE